MSNRPLRILSIDGGGVRGISSLLMLEQIFVPLEKEAGREVRPFEYFDLIGGTSTGGLIAIMLGRLRMSIRETIEAYKIHSPNIFKKKTWSHNKFVKYLGAEMKQYWFEGINVENAVKKILKDRNLDVDMKLFESEDPDCRVFVCTVSAYSAHTELLRSFKSRSVGHLNYDCHIWEAVRATSAAPLYFEPITLKASKATFVDGGVRANNPVFEIASEAGRVWPGREIGSLVSLGTGIVSIQGFDPKKSRLHEVLTSFADIALDADGRAREWKESQQGKKLENDGKYFRFSPPQVDVQTNMDDFGRIPELEARAVPYMVDSAINIEKCANTLLNPTPTSLDPHQIECLRTLYTSDYDSQRDQYTDRVPDTCNWIRTDPRLCTWREDPKSNILWISAYPGRGKSFLAAYLLEFLRTHSSKSETNNFFCHFFFGTQDSAVTALCALLHQIYSSNPSVLYHASNVFRSKGRIILQEYHTLWSILVDTLENPMCGPITCIIDGIDQCDQESRDLLLTSLVQYLSKARQSGRGRFKLILISQGLPSIERALDDLPGIRIDLDEEGNFVNSDIENFVKFKVDKILKAKRISDIGKRLLEEKLMRNTGKTFLWVALVLELIWESPKASDAALQKIIEELPPKASLIYEQILGQIIHKNDAIKALRIVLAAARPLTIQEMNVALVIKNGDKSMTDLDLEPSIETTLKEICRLFIRIIDSRVFLVHESAREYLVQSASTLEMERGFWKYSFNYPDSHSVLLRICFQYLLFLEFEEEPLFEIDIASYAQADRNPEKDKAKVSGYVAHHLFLDYAARNWPQHYRELLPQDAVSVLGEVLQLCDSSSKRTSTWFQIQWTKSGSNYPHTLGFTDLLIASFLNLTAVVKALLMKGFDPNMADNIGFTPLHTAIRFGHLAPAKELISQGANVNTREHEFQLTPLHSAIMDDNNDCVVLLLDNGADITARSGWYYKPPIDFSAIFNKDHEPPQPDGRTPLHWAAKGGNEFLVQLLIQHGADINATAFSGTSVVADAAESGHQTIVALLHRQKAQEFDEALVRASAKGHHCIVKFLLQRGIEPSGKALSEAMYAGQEAVVQSLMARSAELTFEALHGAIKSGKNEWTRLLLGKNIDINKRYLGYSTLEVAIDNDNDVALLLLLESGANVHSTDVWERTALFEAVIRGNEEATHWLIDRGADVNHVDCEGKTPLFIAVRKYDRLIVWLLLRAGANVNVRGADGETPLLTAARSYPWNEESSPFYRLSRQERGAEGLKGAIPPWSRSHSGQIRLALDEHIWKEFDDVLHKTCIDLLSESGARLDAINEKGETLLHAAASQNHDKVSLVQWVVKNRTKIDIEDSDGRTPLHAAVCHRNLEIMAYLIGIGASTDIKDKQKNTLIHSAILGGWSRAETMVETLLSLGAPFQAHGNDGNTPLHLAAMSGLAKSVTLFLDKGADMHAKNDKELAPFSMAAWKTKDEEKALSMMKLLLDRGANLEAAGKFGLRALHIAVAEGRLAMTRFLLDQGADTEATASVTHVVPLSLAVMGNHPEIVKILVDHGANILAEDDNGKTPLYFARDFGYWEIESILLS